MAYTTRSAQYPSEFGFKTSDPSQQTDRSLPAAQEALRSSSEPLHLPTVTAASIVKKKVPTRSRSSRSRKPAKPRGRTKSRRSTTSRRRTSTKQVKKGGKKRTSLLKKKKVTKRTKTSGLRDLIQHHGLEREWNAFEQAALIRIAREWLEGRGLPFRDDLAG